MIFDADHKNLQAAVDSALVEHGIFAGLPVTRAEVVSAVTDGLLENSYMLRTLANSRRWSNHVSEIGATLQEWDVFQRPQPVEVPDFDMADDGSQ